MYGVDVSLIDYDGLTDVVMRLAKTTDAPATVQFICGHSLIEAVRDPAFKEATAASEIVCPDGMSVRWSLNKFHKARLPDRVYAPTAVLKLLAAAEGQGVPVYFYGGTEERLPKLLAKVREQFPDVKIAGAEAPPFRKLTDEEHDAVAERVNASGARLMFLGIGCPKQELFAYRHREDIRALKFGVGAAFDFIAEVKPTAPKVMQDAGLEWLFRMASEPRRLWKRYTVTNSIFLWLFLKRWVGGPRPAGGAA